MKKLPSIFVVSDLHLDSGPFEWSEAALSADLIIVAGDLSNGVFDIEFLKAPNKPLVFVPGNHDFWSADSRDMFDIYADMKRAAEGTQVHVLWDEEMEFEGIRIIGTPLWTDFGGGNEELMRAAFAHSNDYRYTNAKSWFANPENLKLHQEKGSSFTRYQKPDAAVNGDFTPLVAYSLHQKSLAFIESRLKEEFDGCTILVTHMAPSYECLRKSGSVDEHYFDPKHWHCRGRDNSSLARVAAYASDLTKMFDRHRNRLDLAVHGHIHSSLDIVCGSTRVVCNPRGRYSGPLTDDSARGFALLGYPVSKADIKRSQEAFVANPYRGENWDFDANKIVRLEDGLAPALLPIVDDALPRLLELQGEMQELEPFVSHRKPAIRRSVHESAIARAEEFSKIVEGVLRPAQDAFEGAGLRQGDVQSTLRGLGLPTPNYSLYLRFTSPFERKVDPTAVMTDALHAMAHLLSLLHLVPHVAELARKRYQPLVAEALRLIAAEGYAPVLEKAPPADHWRKLYFNLGSVLLEGPEDSIAELSSTVDALINGNKMPRNALLSITAPYRPLEPVARALVPLKSSRGEW